jgi:S1-C subfamily serine protease
VDAEDLPFCELGDSDKLAIGQHVFAVGNPFLLGNGKGAVPTPGTPGRSDGNWEPTVTLGIVSAIHRYQDWYMDAIHTDCQINPGNSGGPLITLEGKVVGINGRIAVRFMNRVNTGIGYSISSNQIKRYLPHLKKGGRVWHGNIDGLTLPAVQDERTPEGYGKVLIVGVDTPSPASEAGFQPGDVIEEIAGYPIFNHNRYFGVVQSFPHGDTVPVKVKRGAGTVELKVWLGSAQREEELRKAEPPKK